MSNNLPIGVFDSGMGGLTVLNELTKHLPHESFLYLGDTARLPYGTKSQEIIRCYSKQMTDILVKCNIKLLVVACNSATSASIPYLKKMFPDLPIIGVVEPGIIAALRETKNNKIAVLATEATVTSQIYQKTIKLSRSNACVISKSCGLLVALAEEGIINDEISYAIINKYIREIEDTKINYDVVILGCTHFPVFIDVFKSVLKREISIVNSARETAAVVESTLEKLGIKSQQEHKSINFMVTDLPDRFVRISKVFLDSHIQPELVSVVDVQRSFISEIK